MTQYVINIGALPNDGTGDPLRTAFNEVNLNFDQVFAAGPVLSNVQIANNTILTTNTNGNLVLAPNGIGVVQSNVNILPNTSNIRNLGSADRRWSTLYIQYANISGAITVTDLTATGNVTVGGNLSVTGNVINVGNIITDAKTIQLANTAGTANAASGSGITVGANDAIATMLYSSATNAWTFNIGVDTPNIVVNNISSDDSTFVTIQDGLDVQGDITAETVSVTGNVTANYFIGNGSQLTGVSNYANANAVAYGQAGWAGNIVPAASNTYSLGNSTLWWSNVWVAGNTMYIGGVPIGMSAGNVLTVNGNAVLQNNSNSTISTTGNITADYFFGNGSQLTGLNTNSISNGTSNVEIPVANGNVTINTNGTYTWTFDDTGNLILPTNGSIVVDGGDGVIGPVSDDLVISWDNEEIRLVSVQGSIEMQADAAFRVQTNYDGGTDTYLSRWEFNQDEIVNITGPSAIVTEAGNLNLQGGRDTLSSGNVTVTAINNGVSVNTWTFDNSGNLIAPGNITTTGNVTGDVGFFNDVIVNNAGTNALLYTNSNREIYDTAFAYDSGNDIISGSGAISTTGNISAGYFIGDGSLLTGLPASYSDSNVATFLAAYGSNTISTTGNITAGNFIGTGSNVELVAGSEQWTFDTTGVLTVPGNITGADVVTANTFVSNAFNVVTAGNLSITSQYGLGFTGTILEENGTLELIANGSGGVVAGWDSTYGNGLGNIATVNFNEVGGEGILLRTGNRAATEYNWNFDNTGNLTLPGNTFAVKYANGTAVSLGGNYGDSNVTTLLGNLGSNNISTTGNVTAGNLIGNIQLTGNIQGTSANVELVAGTYTFTFDNTGVATFPTIGGDEGGEIHLGIPAANTTLQNSVKIDVYQDQLRFFEGSANAKGAYVDLANCPNNVSTAIGYREIPQIAFSANATAAANAAGCHYYSTTAGNLALTLPDNSSVAFPTGATLTVVVNAAGNVLVNQGTGVTLYQAGASATGNRVVGAYGLATVMKVAANTWVISGTGVY